MDILLSGSDWRFKSFLPYSATGKHIWSGEVDWSGWHTATVPGNAQLDLLAHSLIDDPYIDCNSRYCEWVHQRQWAYVKKFLVTSERKGKHIRLIFEGIDYAANIYLNGEHLGYHENLFIPVEYDVTDRLKYGDENTLAVIIEPAPDEHAQIGWTSKTKTVKPRMPYGWDFATRCIPLGIWRDVKLAITGDAWICDCWADTSLSEDFSRGKITFHTKVDAVEDMEAVLQINVSKGDQQVASSITSISTGQGQSVVEIDNPALWWPNGYGEQNVYTADITLVDPSGETLDERSFKFGFKRVRLLPNPDVPEGILPWNFEVNGKRVFIKGWNWVPVDHMYGGNYESRYQRLIRLAAEANVNLLRVWGGGILEHEIFYDLCDRYGIMVWQEFPVSSSGLDNDMPSDPAFIELLRQTGESIVPQRRNHVSHTVWCGGNELTWRGEEDAAMKAEHEVCSRLDPAKLFIPTSPMNTLQHDEPPESDIHGGWQYAGPVEHYRVYNQMRPAFHSEFGAEGFANWENVPRFIQDAELWPPLKDKNEIWSHKGDWWANYPRLVELFGEVTDLKTLFRLSQFIQWEGLRYIIESGRRRKYACGGTIPWQFNEPWPNLSCTNCVDYYTIPKHAYYAVQNAYAPVLVSAKYDKLGWRPGEVFGAELWVTNSGKGMPGAVEYLIADLHGKPLLAGQFSPDIPENGSRRAGQVEWTVPEGFEQIFLLHVRAVDEAEEQLAENVYIFSSAREPIFSSLLHLPKTSLRVLGSEQVKGQEDTHLYISLLNEGDAYALFVRAVPEDNRTEVYFKNNYVTIAPGARITIEALLTKPVSKFSIAGWNTEPVSIP